MELRGLRYFLAVAQELHFGRAAARLNISQPPLTEHIKRLEAELGVLLFARTKRTVRITAAGEALQQEARRLLEDVEDLYQVVRRAEEGMTGILRAGFMSSATFAGVEGIAGHLKSLLPGVSITWHGMPTSEQIHALRSQQIDLGFVHLPADTRRLQVRGIARDELVVGLNSAHRLANQRFIALEDLRDDDFVLSPRSSAPGLHDLILATCVDAGFSPVIRHRARDLLSIISMISVGAGVSLVPAWLTATHFPNTRFQRLKGKAPLIELGIAWNADNASPVLHETLKALKPVFERFEQRERARSAAV
jgi:DNA-binding transcriptional LysR family regulator